MTTIHDEKERQRALDPRTSFIVQAPAGSGKTELLAQRVMVLLQEAQAPEEILAITFTKKAASEMRARILNALQKAHNEPEPTQDHAKKTWRIAKKALERDQALAWNLLNNPNRLRIQTMDSFNVSLTKYLPILSHFGAPPEITDDAIPLYREAVQEFLSHLEENLEWSEAIAQLLIHRDNDLEKVQTLLVNMLAKRDQWLPYIMLAHDQPDLRQLLETHLASVVSDSLAALSSSFPSKHCEEMLALARYAAQNLSLEESASPICYCLDITELPGEEAYDKMLWSGLSELLLTKEKKWRKSIDKKIGFPAPSSAGNAIDKALFKEMKQRMEQLIVTLSTYDKLHADLISLHYAPASEYQENQWLTLHALYQVLRVVVAQLKVVFRLHGKIDYIENAQAALFALGSEEAPTDLALALDYQIRHILIDEFQDTSNSQYRLIEKLTTGWEAHDGRTLFVVGDPMQSIYRFREAEVGLFIRARKQGIGHVKLEPLILSVNFRSTPIIVDWVNTHFQQILPAFEDLSTGAVTYSASIANQSQSHETSLVKLHVMESQQAEALTALILQCKKERPHDTIAILVRARTHLEQIIPALKKAHLPYRAIDIDRLNTRPVIQDLMALTRALLHPGDRIAWLSVLRAPWCGLTLADLLQLTRDHAYTCILDLLSQHTKITTLSAEGQERLSRITPIFQNKLHERRRYHLRLWVESTWLLLGGPACLKYESELEDVASYFSLLEKLDQGGELSNLDNLSNEVKKLFAAPNNQSDNSLQIMTIFNAKGLEFDTVILPHLEKQLPNEKKQLLLWMEKPRENASNALVLAPVHATGEESDAIYEHIKKQHAIKSDHEIGRLLYVAATRAKKQLHLLMTPKIKEASEIPAENKTSKSLLEKLWPSIRAEISQEKQETEPNIDSIEPTETKAVRGILRLTPRWTNPIASESLIDTPSTHQAAPAFQLSQHTPKIIGTLIHRLLQQLSLQGSEWWTKAQDTDKHTYLTKQLLQLGLLPDDLKPTIKLIQTAIAQTLQDPKGVWILHPHTEAQSEFALTAIVENNPLSMVIDRTFIDEHDTRWIIDYKTSHFGEEGLDAFLESEQEKYAKQMHYYYLAMKQRDNRPIKMGLYFPLISAWRAW